MRKTPPPPQPFELACDCGERVTGWRTETHQKLSCTRCDRPLLVLPADVYPTVKRKTAPAGSPASPNDKRRKPSTGGDRKSSSGKKAKKHRDAEATAPVAAAKPEAEPPVAVPEDRIDLSPVMQQEKSRRRRFRWVVAAMIAFIAVTGWSLRNRSQREQARTVIPTATELGLAALRSGDFATADRELTAAVQALDTLGRRDAAAQSIRQAQREAAAANGLAGASLPDLAQEVLTGVGSTEERQRRFQAQYGTKWLIIDAGVVRRAVTDGALYELDVPLSVGDQPLQAECDFPELRRRLAAADSLTPLRVIFAGQLDEWRIPDSKTRPIVARIRPATAFLWSDYDSYRAVGYQPGDAEEAERETRELLTHQRQPETAP